MNNKVWVVDDDQGMRWVVEQALEQANIPVQTFSLATDALKELSNSKPAVVISDIRMPETDGISFMQQIHQLHPELPVIIMTAHSDLDSAVQAYQGGAFEYLPKPFDMDEAVALVERALKTVTQKIVDSSGVIPALVGSSIPMQEIFRNIGRLSRTSVSVLITGESGTGKELIANAVHDHSPRKDKPFIAINTAAIPNELLESELFGHEKGAFTGANARREGRFEQAHGGTLFLDEIGDMPMALQTRLLRVLAEGEFYRVGGNTPIKVDVRIISATNQNLLKQVEKNEFREDLYHRLNVYHIELPALRERKEDIQHLMEHHLQKAAEELDMPAKTLSDKAVEQLKNYTWPGNVRELVNLSQRLTISAPGQQIQSADLKLENDKTSDNSDWKQHIRTWAQQSLSKGEKDLLQTIVPQVEKILLEEALIMSNGHKQNAAKLLGWGRNTLTRKLKELE